MNDTRTPIGDFLASLLSEHRYTVKRLAEETGLPPGRLYSYQARNPMNRRVPDAADVDRVLEHVHADDAVKARALEALAASKPFRSRAS